MAERKVFLLPGEYAFEREETDVSTLLGSCVAVCLHDIHKRWGGMNHYMLPYKKEGGLSPSKYGDFAIQTLVKLALKAGSQPGSLVASIYGGGQVIGHLSAVQSLEGGQQVGTRNIAVAREQLGKMGIRIMREEVGEQKGRKIAMNTATNEIQVRPINPMAANQERAQRISKFQQRKIGVLIIDDSSTVRAVLRQGIERSQDMEVLGEAADPYQARELILELDPDVLCLDIIMPKMDGHTFLQKIMRYKPIPTVIVSTIAQRGSVMRQKVMDSGAVDVIDKEELTLYKGPQVIEQVLLPKLRAAAKTTVVKRD